MDQAPKNFVLASGSQIRKDLLKAAGYEFTAVAATLDEEACIESDPDRRAAILARDKALEVASQFPDALVLGSDQVFAFEGEVRSKPESDEALRDQLRLINGKSHRFHCGLALVRGRKVVHEEVCHAEVQLYDLSEEELLAYAATREGIGCAGGYRLEDRGIHILRGIKGSHFTVLGLPMFELAAALRRLGWDKLFFASSERSSL
ncbi:MAG: Maf family protein [Planctomycetota bacterium]